MNIVPQTGEAQVLEHQTRAGANWIYWVVGLTIISTIANLAGLFWGSYIALDLPLALAFMARHSSVEVKVIIGAVCLLICGVFALLGFFASKGARWAFILGIIFYLLDTIVTLIGRDWIGIALHAYVIWRIGAGMMAAFALAKLRKAQGGPAGYQGVRGMQNTPPNSWPAPPTVPPAQPTQPSTPSSFARPTLYPPTSPLPSSAAEPPQATPLPETTAPNSDSAEEERA